MKDREDSLAHIRCVRDMLGKYQPAMEAAGIVHKVDGPAPRTATIMLVGKGVATVIETVDGEVTSKDIPTPEWAQEDGTYFGMPDDPDPEEGHRENP